MAGVPGGAQSRPFTLSDGRTFLHRLAVNLGKSLEEIRALPLSELQSWHEYDNRELLPDRRTEIQMAQIAYIQACSGSRNPGQYKLSDFMPSASPRMQTPEEFYRSLTNG